MILETYRFTSTGLAAILGVNERTVQGWCQSNKIRCKKDAKSQAYTIFGDGLVDFLYRNPKYANPFLEKKCYGVLYMLQEEIRKELSKYPKSYTFAQLSRRYCITENAVRYWEHSGVLHNTARAFGVNGIFEKDLVELFNKNPRIASRYSLMGDDNDMQYSDIAI